MPHTLAQDLPILWRQPGQSALIQQRGPDEEAEARAILDGQPVKVRSQSVNVAGPAVGRDNPPAGYVKLCPLPVELRLGHVAGIAKAGRIAQGRVEHRCDKHGKSRVYRRLRCCVPASMAQCILPARPDPIRQLVGCCGIGCARSH
jgi:hypothetical protein